MSDLAAERLAEAAQIESEWNAMSYKDRAAWWMSAKWYGYMPADAYRRGDPISTDVSSRYGEPGFFIATRVPYFEAQSAVSTIVATATPAEAAPEAVVPPVEPETRSASTDSTPEPVATSAEPETAPAPTEAASLVRESITNSVSETETPILAAAIATSSNANPQQKKKKKKHHTKHMPNPGEGKTIQIRLGGEQSK